MQRDLPWPGGERGSLQVVAGHDVDEADFQYALVRLQLALAGGRYAADVLAAVTAELATSGLALRDLGMTPASWYVELRRAASPI